MITAVIVAIVQHVPGINPSPTPDPGASPTNLRSGGLVRIDAVTLEHNWGARGGSFAFGKPYAPTPADLVALNAIQQRRNNGDTQSDEYDTWFRSRGAVDPGIVDIKLVLRGNSTQQVRITGIRLKKQCSSPLTGTFFYSPAAGSDESVRLTYDLDQADPIATYTGQDFKQHPYFDDHTISLQPNEQMVVEVRATTQQHYCTFTPVLEIVNVDGMTSQTVPAPDGKDFHVTANPDDTKRGAFSQFSYLYVGGVASNDGFFHQSDPKGYSP